MNDATNGQDWTAPGGTGTPTLPDALASSAPPSPPASAAPGYVPPTVPTVVTAAAPVQAAPTFRSWQPGIIPLRPVSFGEFLSVPFKAMRFNRAVVIGGPLVCVGVAMLLLAAALWLAFTDPSLALLSPTSQFSGVEASTVIVAIAAAVALVLADAIACTVVAPGVARAVLGERIPVGESFKLMGKHIGSLLGLWLLYTAAVTIALGPGIAAMIWGAESGDSGIVLLGLLMAGTLSLIVAVPAYLITAIARCVIVLERKGAVAAIKRTVSVMRGRFWWSMLILLVTSVLIYLVTQVLQTMLSFVGMIAFSIGVSGEWVGIAVFIGVTVIGAVVTYVFTYAYMGCVYAFMYIDARIRHEGFDLDLARAAEARRG